MDEPELKIIDVFVCKLRKKLVEATGEDSCIQTVWGRGYVLKDPLPDMATKKSPSNHNWAGPIPAFDLSLI
jgi:two-component system cell cycle response regulator CtrA